MEARREVVEEEEEEEERRDIMRRIAIKNHTLATLNHLLQIAKAQNTQTQLLSLCQAIATSSSSSAVPTTTTTKPINELERFLSAYQEHPQALDPCLETAMNILTTAVLSALLLQPVNPNDELCADRTMRAIYLLCKTRGCKYIERFLPHRVSDFHAILAAMDGMAPDRPWETKYVLLLWMSVLCLLPFKLDSLVLRLPDVATHLVDSILFPSLGDAGPTREVAATCLARILSRPDTHTLRHRVFVNIRQEFGNTGDNTPKIRLRRIGALQCLVQFFKRCSMGDNSQHVASLASETLSTILPVVGRGMMDSSLEKKYASKLARYAGCYMTKAQQHGSSSDSVLEIVVTTLLEGLRDKDTVTRWSSAKGVAQVMELLPSHHNEQIINFILEFFVNEEGDAGWHGACLCLAEICRKRDNKLLSPSLVQRIVRRALVPALEFDRVKGISSVGTHVRDAACFLAWSLARSGTVANLAQDANFVARKIIMVSLFDREVNCRRAASAAFQELVGRSGREIFPCGIEMLTIADFVALGNMSRAYLDVAPAVIKLGGKEYVDDAIATLIQLKLIHWDGEVRRVAAGSLKEIFRTSLPATVMDTGGEDWKQVMRILTQRAIQCPATARHGALLGLAACCSFCCTVPDCGGDGMLLHDMLTPICDCCSTEVGENKAALCDLVGSALPYLRQHMVLELIERILEPALKDNVARDAARRALQYALILVQPMAQEFMNRWCIAPAELWRVSAIGALVSAFNVLELDSRIKVHEYLVNAAMNKKIDVMARRDAMVELGGRWGLVDVESTLRCAVQCMRDYTTDERGDVGSHVRIASLQTVHAVYDVVGEDGCIGLLHVVWGECSKLASDKLDVVRVVAYRAFVGQWCPRAGEGNNDAHTFAMWCDALLVYNSSTRRGMLEGLVLACGALTESSSKRAQTALLKWCTSADFMHRAELADVILAILRWGTCLPRFVVVGESSNMANEKIVVPTLKTLSVLLSEGVFDDIAKATGAIWPTAMRERVGMLMMGCKSPARLVAAAKVLIGLGGYGGDVPSLMQVVELLAHEFPKVRMACAEYLCLWGASLVGQEYDKMANVLDMVGETRWELFVTVDEARMGMTQVKIMLGNVFKSSSLSS